MSKLILHPDYQLYERKDLAFCSSLQIALAFAKEHKNVLADIRNLDCSDDFRQLNFQRTSQNVDMPNGGSRKEPIFLMTKDGFIFLVMGYRGKKAATIKEAYIQRFNDMEKFIKEYLLSRDDNPIFTQAIMDSHEIPKSFHYSNEYDMINRIVLGCTAKEYKINHNIIEATSIRPFLTRNEQKAIRLLQREDVRLLYRGIAFQERKHALMALFLKHSNLLEG